MVATDKGCQRDACRVGLKLATDGGSGDLDPCGYGSFLESDMLPGKIFSEI